MLLTWWDAVLWLTWSRATSPARGGMVEGRRPSAATTPGGERRLDEHIEGAGCVRWRVAAGPSPRASSSGALAGMQARTPRSVARMPAASSTSLGSSHALSKSQQTYTRWRRRGTMVPAGMDELILYEVDERVATVTLNRPEKLNAITPELQRELLRALGRAADDPAVHVAVVRGAGRAFSAGYDVTSGGMAASGVPADRLQLERIVRGWLEIWDLPLPVIAQVHGLCLAGGTQLAAICDVTLVADDARIGTPQLPLGAGYVASFWAWFVGPKKAKEVFFPTGAIVTAAEVVAMGLFNRIVPAAELDAEVQAYARSVARTPKDLLALQKLAINRTQEAQGFRQALLQGAEVDAIAHASPAVRAVNRYIGERGLKEALAAFQRGDLP
jgi:enoyl-CoA hydratase